MLILAGSETLVRPIVKNFLLLISGEINRHKTVGYLRYFNCDNATEGVVMVATWVKFFLSGKKSKENSYLHSITGLLWKKN